MTQEITTNMKIQNKQPHGILIRKGLVNTLVLRDLTTWVNECQSYR